jgi:hypothetical protein
MDATLKGERATTRRTYGPEQEAYLLARAAYELNCEAVNDRTAHRDVPDDTPQDDPAWDAAIEAIAVVERETGAAAIREAHRTAEAALLSWGRDRALRIARKKGDVESIEIAFAAAGINLKRREELIDIVMRHAPTN